MARTNRLKASMVLAATITAALLAMLLAAQEPAPAGIIIDDGLCLSGPEICPADTSITSGPAQNEFVYTDSVSFGFASSESPSTFQCKLDDGAFESCTSPRQYTNLSDGQHTFQVKATDPQGDVDPTPASRTWYVYATQPPPPDITPPETSINSCCQPDVSKNTTASFAFAGSDDRTTASALKFECRLDSTSNSDWLPCTSPQNYPGLSDGTHKFEVRAIDAALNPDPTPASRQFTIDTTPPDTTITSGPSGTVSSTSASFAFDSSESNSSFRCRVSGGVWGDGIWSTCQVPWNIGPLPDDTYTFEVYAVDSVGNADPDPASRTWTVDVPPSVPVITSPNDNSFDTDGTFTVSGSGEMGSTVELFEGSDSKGTVPVDSSGQWSILLSGVPEGSHNYTAKATDASNITSTASSPLRVVVDATAPSAPVINAPTDNSFDTDGTITVSGTAEANSTVSVFEATASGDTSKGTAPVDASGNWTKTISGVSDGSHAYKAKARDAAGNTSGFSNSLMVVVDKVKPKVSSTTPLNGATNVGLGTNLTATFSEKMRTSTVNKNTFKLYKVKSDGTQTQITKVTVSLSPDGLKATLNPFGVQTPSLLLARNTKYKGVLTTGAKDPAGNSLAQQKSWTFTTKP
jgi:hypothetical protein